MALLMGCSGPSVDNVSSNTLTAGYTTYKGQVRELIIDGHTYIKVNRGVAHSGSCGKCKQELYSIIRKAVKDELGK